MADYLLATDLDDTLLGNDEAIKRLETLLQQISTSHSLRLAYVTGRSLTSFQELIQEKQLPTPTALVTALSTEIYVDRKQVTSWPEVNDWNRNSLTNILNDFPTLQLQPDSEQREYKISYFIDNDTQTVDALKRRLQEYPVHISYSMNRHLDILPQGVNKGSALQYLSKQWNISEGNIFCAGDSLNDVNMLKVGNAIVVGNAKDELTSWAKDWHGIAYIAKNHYADAIIEGLKYYKLAE